MIDFNNNVYIPDVLAIGTIYKNAGWLYGGGLAPPTWLDYGTYEKVPYDHSTAPAARRRDPRTATGTRSTPSTRATPSRCRSS